MDQVPPRSDVAAVMRHLAHSSTQVPIREKRNEKPIQLRIKLKQLPRSTASRCWKRVAEQKEQPQALPPHQVSGLTNSSTLQEKVSNVWYKPSCPTGVTTRKAANRLPAPTPKQKKTVTNARVRHIWLYSLRATNLGVTKVNPSNTQL
eukprot:g72668.t1